MSVRSWFGARRRSAAVLTVALVVGASLSSPVPATAQGRTFLLVVAGIGGDAEHRERFVDRATTLARAATETHGLPGDRVILLVERVELAPEVAAGRSDREGIEAAFEDLAGRTAAGDQVIVVLIGHGTARGGEARFNIPGPDVGPDDFDALLGRLRDRSVALVNTTSASGPFLPALSGPGRAVITATRSERERDEAVFGQFFVEALAGLEADLDKDGRVSVLEAFRHANREVERHYGGGNRLRTEHALLDDDGDGEGTDAPDPRQGGEGALAARIGLGGPSGAPTAGADEVPEVAALREERQEVQERLDRLMAGRDGMPEAEYLERLEELLVELSRIDERIRELSGEGS